MLEKPDIPDQLIIECLERNFALEGARLQFLPLGADPGTAVYRAEAGGKAYFVKLRSGVFNETSVTLPRYLSDQGVAQVIPPLTTSAGDLWAELGAYRLILYPFVEGRNGYEVELSDDHWRDFGAALRRIHDLPYPARITRAVRRESFSGRWRRSLRRFLAPGASFRLPDEAAQALFAFVQEKREEIAALASRSEALARGLRTQQPEHTLCHSDLHAGNIFIDGAGRLYLIDWDAPILAPRERDLMYAGGGQFGSARPPDQEEALFYQGYGEVPVDRRALAYYRYERIVEDLAIYCEQLLLSDAGGEDRAQSRVYFQSNFQPGGTLDIARRADPDR